MKYCNIMYIVALVILTAINIVIELNWITVNQTSVS